MRSARRPTLSGAEPPRGSSARRAHATVRDLIEPASTDQSADALAERVYDCAVIGAGPAGLSAALYMARFRRSVVVFDGGRSRASAIGESHNSPGFPGGISGDALLARQREQLAGYGVTILRARVETLAKADRGFSLAHSGGCTLLAQKVLLATGIVDVLPDVDWIDEAVDVGAMRLCPICDGYEVIGERLAVSGPATAIEHAVFLRTWSSQVSLVLSGGEPLDQAQSALAEAFGVRIIDHGVQLHFDGRRCSFALADGSVETFDSVYPFLGSNAQSALAQSLGAALDEDGALRTDRDQMTTIDGLYAAGDVTSALNQITVAVGHSAIAASAMHRALGENPA